MTAKRKKRPYGLWKSPLSADLLANDLRFSDVLWDGRGETLIWREERSDRGVVAALAVGDPSPVDLSNIPVHARVGYGGGEFTVHGEAVYFVSDGRIYRRSSVSDGEPMPITPRCGQCASPAVSPDAHYLVYVHSSEGKDVLAVTDTEGRHWPAKLTEGHDFYMQPCWHPAGTQLAWIAWDHPNMPWNGTALYLADLASGERLPVVTAQQIVAGSPFGDAALFQPSFSPDGRYLSYISNERGWFNLFLLDLQSGKKDLMVDEAAELGVPAWVQGLRTHAWTADANAIYFIRLKEGFTSLARLDVKKKHVQTITAEIQEYSLLQQISVSPGREEVATIGSSPGIPPRILTVGRQGEVRVHRRSSSEAIRQDYFSRPQPLVWDVKTPFAVKRSHGLYYPPANPEFESDGLPPAILSIHGGPTSQYTAGYHADTQFLTSRGFAVLEINHRGSSGYGKAYMDALKGNWGVADVEDVRAAAEYLADRRLADPGKLVVSGGSAGGYTVLLALAAFPKLFSAGICRYAVANLFTLAEATHKFEAHYLDTLIGVLPRDSEKYCERSPVFCAERIQVPVAIFQGDEDEVVPKSQSDEIVESLAGRNVPHLYRVYPGEGHGWRKSETVKDYFETVEQFLREFVSGNSLGSVTK